MKRSVFSKGILKENAVLGIVVGVCPVLAVTRGVREGLALGLAMTLVLVFGNLTVSFFKRFVRGAFRLPVFLMTAALYTSVIEINFRLYHRSLYQSLGIFLPLIAVNCLVPWRMDEGAVQNPAAHAALDGLGFGVGFLLVIFFVSLVRELLGAGTVLGWPILGKAFHEFPVLFFVSPAGGFLVLGALIGLYRMAVKRDKA
jgi:electron transport complex protein RnfE